MAMEWITAIDKRFVSLIIKQKILIQFKLTRVAFSDVILIVLWVSWVNNQQQTGFVRSTIIILTLCFFNVTQ